MKWVFDLSNSIRQKGSQKATTTIPSKPNTRQVDASNDFISVPFIRDAYNEASLPLGVAPVFVFAKLSR